VSSREVGRVVALWRYPVKSMAAEPLDAVDVSWNGFSGERRWAFIRDGLERSGFPWLTIRELPELRHHVPFFVDPDRPDTSTTMIRTPDARELDVTDPSLAAKLGDGVRVIKQDVGVFDTMPLSLITTRTIAGLGEHVGVALEPQRFRPNLLVEALSDEPFPEDAWVGSVLQIGGFRMRVDKRDQRCVMVNIDPVTNKRDASVLRGIAKQRQSCLGVYGSTVEPGRVAVGDEVLLEET
jgi:uncharacterized protein YcbX